MQGGKNLDFAERDKSKPVLHRLSLAGNLENPPRSLYIDRCRERGYGLCSAWILDTGDNCLTFASFGTRTTAPVFTSFSKVLLVPSI
jgi:hypothetical protein